jgi:hypothetical protein
VRIEYGWPVNARDVKFDVVLVDKDGKPISVLTSDKRKEKGQFFFSIGYPF